MSVPEETKPLTPEVGAYAHDYPKGHHILPHHHAWHQLVYARAGVMTVSTADGAWVVPPQRAVWMPAATEHEIRCASAVSMRTLYLAPTLRAPLPAACCVVQVPPLLRELILASVEAPGPAPRRSRLAALLLLELAAAAVAPLHLPEPSDPRVRRITEALRAEPGDPRTLAAWGKEVGASPRTLSRRFLSETGMTFRQWQRQARLLAALVRLAQGHPVTSVALDLGYDSPSAFIHAFRRALGKTPRAYFGPADMEIGAAKS
jgi:AraC-like DNA-binding protein